MLWTAAGIWYIDCEQYNDYLFLNVLPNRGNRHKITMFQIKTKIDIPIQDFFFKQELIYPFF